MGDLSITVQLRPVICWNGHTYAYLVGTCASGICPTCAGEEVKSAHATIETLSKRVSSLKGALTKAKKRQVKK